MGWQDLYHLLGGLGGTGAAVVLVLLFRGDLRMRREVEREKSICELHEKWGEFWRAKALEAWDQAGRATDVTIKAVETAEKVVEKDRKHRQRNDP